MLTLDSCCLNLQCFSLHFWQSGFQSDCLQNTQNAVSDSLMFQNVLGEDAPRPTYRISLLGDHTPTNGVLYLIKHELHASLLYGFKNEPFRKFIDVRTLKIDLV